MLTFQEIQKLVKEETDKLFTDFKGTLSSGGNIFHKRKISDASFDMIFQTVYNKNGIYPVQISFCKINLYVNYILGIIYQSTPRVEQNNGTLNIKAFSYPNKTFGWFEICNMEDINTWRFFLENEVKPLLRIFNQLNDNESFEIFYNKEIIDNKLFDNCLDFKNLILAKLCKKYYYNELLARIIKSCEIVNNNFAKELTLQLDFFLNSCTIEQLNDLEYLKLKLKNK